MKEIRKIAILPIFQNSSDFRNFEIQEGENYLNKVETRTWARNYSRVHKLAPLVKLS